MRVLIDTNIFIYREGATALPESFQALIKKLNENGVPVIVHPESIKEITDDPNAQRRELNLSKVKTYPVLEVLSGTKPDERFESMVGKPSTENERVDDALLFSVCRDAVDFFITEDKEIQKKALQLGLIERVLNIEDALDLFRRYFPELKRLSTPPSIEEVPVSSIDVEEPLLDSLRQEYNDPPGEFRDWFSKISRKGRKAWIQRKADKKLGAIMVYKEEDDAVELTSSFLPAKKRVKICLLKSDAPGQKLGELFLKIAFDYALKCNRDELYLTHYTKEADSLVALIQTYGFVKAGSNKRGEEVFVKRFFITQNQRATLSPAELTGLAYPSFYDGEKAAKFIIPIQPQYHERLFIEQPRNSRLSEFSGEMIVEGNSITKAYLCNAKIKKMKPGDVVLFYQSGGKSEITCLGTVEQVYQNQTDAQQIRKIVGKRTVYSLTEIGRMALKPTLVIRFRWHFDLKKPLKYMVLSTNRVLAGPPQSILQLNEEQYRTIKALAGIDPRFILS
ncbi:MAG: EVE domain-containing protein [Candidatus Micrarchaeota archaeon]